MHPGPLHELLSRFRTLMVKPLALTQIQGGNCGHVVIRERKVKNREVFDHPLFVRGFRNHDDVALREPPEGRLRRGFTVFRADCRERPVSKQPVLESAGFPDSALGMSAF